MFTIFMLISHIIGDFLFQTNKIVEQKSHLSIKGYLKHAGGLIVTSLIIFIFIKFESYPELVKSIFIIVVIHIILDFLKELLQKSVSKNKKIQEKDKIILGLFIFDQFFHIITILAVTNGVELKFNSVNNYLVSFAPSSGIITYDALKIVFIVAYIALSGAYFIPLIFNLVYSNVPLYNKLLSIILKKGIEGDGEKFIDEVKTGKWIGVLERILIVILLNANQLSAIGLIIAMKSLARFKMMENKIFSEYYLLGTLISVVYTFILYYMLNSLL